ncbi:MAG: ABC transporter ATP-binding protein [Flavobacteriales bacterium]|nr:ABC transporter ATP-binding protein [Flavobacteriales bacterium]|tara:strand:- start:182 stop:808 length:627 start_codon:yes stop_codon:yes gene_type:complete
MLKTRAIRFSYDNNNQFSFPDINLRDGEELLILGKSGVGKTTLVQIIAGLLKPSSGLIEYNGIHVNNLLAKKLDSYRGKHVGMVFQKPRFVKNISVLDNLLLSLYLSRNKQDIERTMNLLSQVDLSHKANSMPNNLSQGEQQRAAIALAVVKNPSMILADEPTSSLDDINCQKILNLLKQHAKSTNAKLIIITHDQRLKSQFNKSIKL